MGRQSANTKLSSNVAVRKLRVRGGNFKFRALRLDTGNFAWPTEVRGCVSVCVHMQQACIGSVCTSMCVCLSASA